MNPFKSLKYLLWNNYKMCLIKFLVIGLLVALMGLFFYSMPVRAPFEYDTFTIGSFFVVIKLMRSSRFEQPKRKRMLLVRK